MDKYAKRAFYIKTLKSNSKKAINKKVIKPSKRETQVEETTQEEE